MLKKTLNWLGNYRTTPLILLLLTILSYGLFSRAIGFIMDDMYIIWFGHAFGAAQYPLYYASDRPLMGCFFAVASTLLGGSESPFTWQLFALLLRWLCSWALWGMLNTIWPNAKRQNTWVALLAAVFPGFTQHWIVVVYSVFYACLAGFFLSITLMIKAIREPRRFWIYYPLSILLSLYVLLAVEYYYGLELIRAVILWLILSSPGQRFRSKVLQTLKYWSPYLLILVVFTVWRAFFFTSAVHKFTALGSLQQDPLSALRSIYQAGVDALVSAWTATFNLSNYPGSGLMSWVILALVVLVAAGLLLWLAKAARDEPLSQASTGWAKEAFWLSRTAKNDFLPDATAGWAKPAFWLGLIALVVAILPFWAAGLPVTNQYPYDRFMLAYLLGSCLLIVALLEGLSSQPKRITWIIAFLVACGVGYQFAQGLRYRNIWAQQASLYWQLNWRMPGIQPQTTLMAGSLPDREYASQNSIAAQLNWTYADKIPASREIPYFFVLLNSTQIPAFQTLAAAEDFTINFRSFQFQGNTSKSVLISYAAGSCLRVLDAHLTPPTSVLDDYSKEILDAADLTDLSLILLPGTTPNHPPLNVMGPEPARTWCYYFEQAELARQYQNYPETVSLLNQAQGEGFSPNNASEWYPFLDAYLHLGELDQARTISQKILDAQSKIYEIGMCNVWQNYAAEKNDPTQSQVLDDELKALSCK